MAGIDQYHKQNSMLINIDGGITENLINMLAVPDPITGKTGDAREELFSLHCEDWNTSEIYLFILLFILLLIISLKTHLYIAPFLSILSVLN